MPTAKLKDVLGPFKGNDLTVKLCSTIFGIVPGGPEFVFYNDVQGAVNRLAGGDADILAKAQELAKSEDMGTALWVADKLDMADTGLSIYSGAKMLFSLFGGSGPKTRTFESDPQQAADAGLKAVGLAYMIHKMFPGGISEKISLFRELPAGTEIGVFYATAEVALPFADNLAEAGGNLISKIMGSSKGDVSSKFSSVIGGDAFAQATGVMEQFAKPLGGYVDQAKGYTGPVIEKVKRFMPSGAAMMNAADSVTGAMATGIDLMPVWRFLGGRLVAEACVLRAQRGI